MYLVADSLGHFLELTLRGHRIGDSRVPVAEDARDQLQRDADVAESLARGSPSGRAGDELEMARGAHLRVDHLQGAAEGVDRNYARRRADAPCRRRGQRLPSEDSPERLAHLHDPVDMGADAPENSGSLGVVGGALDREVVSCTRPDLTSARKSGSGRTGQLDRMRVLEKIWTSQASCGVPSHPR
jgi:hypothetical protein